MNLSSRLLLLFGWILPLCAQEVQPKAEKKEWPPSGKGLFEKGLALGYIRENPKGSFRRIYQRTLMPTEPKLYYNAVLTFDDQLIPFTDSEASALEVAKDLAPRGARAVFFANVPGLASPSLRPILRLKSSQARKEACLELLNSKREEFIQIARQLIRMKQGDLWLCEVHNHTAFHQNMRNFQMGSARMELCMLGIRFIEECLDEAYAAERPGFERDRYFRFPFLGAPKYAKPRGVINDLFTELGLISVGETQDSKDYSNGSSKEAYKALVAARKGKRYSVKKGAYSTAQLPVALFHTKTWRKIGPGVLKALDEAKALERDKVETPE